MFTVTTMTMRTARLVTHAVTTAAASIAAIDMERTLTQLPFWPSLTEQEQETLHRSAFVRHYEKGAFVHSSDNECLGMLFILSGEIRTYLLSDEGREAVARMLKSFSEDELVELKRGAITLRDKDRLNHLK